MQIRKSCEAKKSVCSGSSAVIGLPPLDRLLCAIYLSTDFAFIRIAPGTLFYSLVIFAPRLLQKSSHKFAMLEKRPEKSCKKVIGERLSSP